MSLQSLFNWVSFKTPNSSLEFLHFGWRPKFKMRFRAQWLRSTLFDRDHRGTNVAPGSPLTWSAYCSLPITKVAIQTSHSPGAIQAGRGFDSAHKLTASADCKWMYPEQLLAYVAPPLPCTNVHIEKGCPPHGCECRIVAALPAPLTTQHTTSLGERLLFPPNQMHFLRKGKVWLKELNTGVILNSQPPRPTGGGGGSHLT